MEPTQKKATALAGKRILLVDDDPDMLMVLKTVLGSEGYAIDTASNGEECLKKVAAGFPDLIILDVMMPRMNGVEVTRKLKAHPKASMIPIIMLTALSDKKYMQTALFELDVDYYLTKPFDQEEMLDKVRQAILYKRGY